MNDETEPQAEVVPADDAVTGETSIPAPHQQLEGADPVQPVTEPIVVSVAETPTVPFHVEPVMAAEPEPSVLEQVWNEFLVWEAKWLSDFKQHNFSVMRDDLKQAFKKHL